MHLFSLAFTLTVYSLYHMQHLHLQMTKPTLKVVIKLCIPTVLTCYNQLNSSVCSSNLLPAVCNFHFELVYVSGSG